MSACPPMDGAEKQHFASILRKFGLVFDSDPFPADTAGAQSPRPPSHMTGILATKH